MVTERKILTQDYKPGNLQDGIQLLINAMRALDATVLADATGIVFARYLDYKRYVRNTAQAKLEYDACKVAAFVLTNQIFFYQALSLDDSSFTPLETSPNLISTLKDLFKSVTKTGFAPIFAPNIADFLPEDDQIIAVLNSVVILAYKGAQKERLNWTQGFAKLIPIEIRKHIAAFYTSPVGAELLANLSIHSHKDAILDLACGTGTLLVHGYRRKQSILKQSNLSSSSQDVKIHHQFLQEIHGNDVVSFATHLAAMNLALLGVLNPPRPIHVTAGDGFKVKVQTQISSSGISFVDVVLMNPPFTRHERIAPEFLQAIQEQLAGEGYGDYIAGKMSLQHYFLFHADSFLVPGGRLAFVLPANTFNVDLSEKLVQFLVDKRYHVEYLVAVNSRTGGFSEDCNYKEYLFVATKGALTDITQTKLVLFSELPPVPELGDFIEFLRATPGPASFKRDGINLDVKCVNTRQLYAEDKWDAGFWDLNDPELLSLLSESPKLVPLAQSGEFTFVTGFHSTHCDLLILPNRLFKLVGEMNSMGLEIERRHDGARVIIPRDLLRPCLRESKLYQGIYATSRHWVVSVDKSEQLPPDVHRVFLEYTAQVLQDQVREKARKGGKVREHLDGFWYAHPRATGCDTKVGHCWTFNRYGLWRRSNAAFYTDVAVTGNDGFHIYAFKGSDSSKQEALQILASWFNTSLHLFDFLRKCRVPATHVQQSLKPDRELMYVPIFEHFTPVERKSILTATRSFNQTMQGTILEQLEAEPRHQFDEAWLTALGIPRDQQAKTLNKLYPVLRHVIAVR